MSIQSRSHQLSKNIETFFGLFGAGKKFRTKSIRVQLTISLLTSLGALWVACLLVAYNLAACFANDSYDRQLLNSADSVAGRLRYENGHVLMDLPAAAQTILRHNEQDEFYYQIISRDGVRIGGDSIIPGPYPSVSDELPQFRSSRLYGQDVRIARFKVDVHDYPEHIIFVQVAETTASRQQLTDQILLSIVLPQLFFLMLGALVVWRGVSRGLSPLIDLKKALEVRSSYDLTPVNSEKIPDEIMPLLQAINRLFGRVSDDIGAQQRFVSNAAHQLKTPISGLKAYVYTARKLPADPKLSGLLAQIDTGVERLARLTSKLLVLSRVEPSHRKCEYERIDLNLIVSAITAEFYTQAQNKAIELTCETGDVAAFIMGDAVELRELVSNLIENAIAYTQNGGSVVACVFLEGRVSLSVEDNGPGIPEKERQHIFERFYRVLGTSETGSGLGLAIVKEIATNHKGEITLESAADGTGTRITVSFPVG